MVELYRYSHNFDPILLEGLTATLFGSELPDTGLNVKCKAVVAMPERYVSFGALTASTWDTDNEDTGLELNKFEFGQFRMRILDDMQCRLKNPAAVSLWRSTRADFYLPQYPMEPGQDFLKEYLFRASEFFVWEDDTPRFDFLSPVALTTSRVLFSGWRFKVAKITEKGKIDIFVNSWPSSA